MLFVPDALNQPNILGALSIHKFYMGHCGKNKDIEDTVPEHPMDQ